MKMPDIEYGPVQRSSDAPALVGDAAQRMTSVIAEGLTRYGQELVKTRSARAGVDVQEGLAKLEEELSASPYVSAKYVRDQLGDRLGTLPKELRDQLTFRDPETGLELDNEQLPTWAFAGAIYEKRAQELVRTASKTIPGEGWQASFQDAARGDVGARLARFNAQQLRGLHAFLVADQRDTVRRLAVAGDFDGARRELDRASALDPAEKVEAVDAIEKARQLRPYEEAVVAGVRSAEDAARAKALMRELEAGRVTDQEGKVLRELDRLDPKDRLQWKTRLEAEVREFEAIGKDAAAHPFREADEAARNAILGAYLKAPGRPLPMAIVPRPGTVSAGTLQWAIGFVESTKPSAKPRETDLAAYATLTRLATQDPAAFKATDLSPFLERLSVPHATHFLDLQRTLKVEGPDGPKYSGFVGAQEETNRLLRGHGFAVAGKEAEDDAQAVGWVHSRVNHALFEETRKKGRELQLDERDAIIGRTVAREVNAKGWKAASSSAGALDPAYAGPLRETAAALGRPQDAKALGKMYEVVRLVEPEVEAAWQGASAKILRPADVVGVYRLMARDQAQIDAALAAAGQPVNSTTRAAAATRAYLGGAR